MERFKWEALFISNRFLHKINKLCHFCQIEKKGHVRLRTFMCESVTLDVRIRAYLSITRSGIDRDHAVVEVVLETNLWQEDFQIFSGNKAI